jgi:hypothetical protein
MRPAFYAGRFFYVTDSIAARLSCGLLRKPDPDCARVAADRRITLTGNVTHAAQTRLRCVNHFTVNSIQTS